MRSLLRYLLRNYAFVLFVMLEATALTLIFSYNSYQRAKYLNSANWLSGTLYGKYSNVKDYFSLVRINRQLAEENVRLRTELDRITSSRDNRFMPGFIEKDSSYNYILARVINNSINKPFNYITLNKGRKHGIRPDQGIISPQGIVGVVTNVSESYAVAMSVLNSHWSISAKLKKSGYFGSLIWSDDDYRVASLNEIPLHLEISEGDTIVTSGYSSIFPGGIMIGTIKDFSRPEGENYYDIQVLLSTDFKGLSYVEVIESLNKPEIWELEKVSGDDQQLY